MSLASRLFGALIAWLVGSVLRVRRAHVVESMRRAGIARPEATATRMYRSLGRGLGELLAMALAPRRSLAGLVQLDEIRVESGFVAATAHTGNWDLVACAAAEKVPLTVVTKRLSIGLLDRLWQGARRARGVRLVGVGEARRAAQESLAAGQVVAMLVDQAPERERGTTLVPFLGQLARVDLAPALLAARAGVPLVSAFALRQGDGTHRLLLGEPRPPPARNQRAWAEAAMREVTAELEALVREHPEQWLWMHRRWKAAPAESSLVARVPEAA